MLACLAASPAAQAASAVWGGLHPIPEAHSLEDVLWNPGRSEYVAVGEGGAILTSTDRLSWTVRTSNTAQKIYSVIWDDSRYVATGEGGMILTSTNGVTWTPRDTNQRNVLFDLAWNGSVYVAIGQEGTLYTSTDAQTWTEQDPDTGALLQGIAWNANIGLFAAVGSSRTIITSPDGVTWTVQMRGSFTDQDITLLEEVATDGLSTFVVVGRAGKIYTSSDGINWTERTSGTNQGLQGVTWTGTRFVAVGIGDEGDPDDPADDVPSVAVYSPDGTTWTAASATNTTRVLRAVAGNGADLVAVGEGAINTSDDGGDTWTDLVSAVTDTLNDIAWDGSQYVAVGDAGTILTSGDGDNWSAQDSEVPSALRGIAWRAGPQYVAVGDDATILTSSDGSSWSAAPGNPLTTKALRDVILAGSRYFAVGDEGTILTSSDGDNWSTVPQVTPSNLNGIAYSNGQYVAVGDEATILTSTDGTSWTQASLDSALTDALNDVAFVHDGGILAVGEGGLVLEAVTGGGWTRRNAGTGNTMHGILSNSRQVMLVGDAGIIRRSENGLRWTSLLADTEKNLRAIVWDNERFLAAGETATILTSGGVDMAIEVAAPDSATINNAKDDGAGTVFVYTVTNIANLDVPSVQFQNPVPAEFDFVDVVAPPQLDSDDCVSVTGASVTCNLGTVIGGAAGLQITVVLNPRFEGTYQHNASVSAAGDTNTANNAISSTVEVGPEVFDIPNPDVEFDKDTGLGAIGGRTLALLALLPLARLGTRRRGHRPGGREPRRPRKRAGPRPGPSADTVAAAPRPH